MKRNHTSWVILLTLSVVSLFGLLARPLGAHAPEITARGEIEAAWQRADELGAYGYTSDIVQTTWPLPKLENVGLSSQTDRLYIEGRVDRHADTMNLLLWSQGGSVRTREGAIELRVSGDETQGRVGESEWKDLDDFNPLFAPDNDPLSFLAGLDEVVKEDVATRSLAPSGASERLTRYRFDLNGPAFAAHMRDQLEAELVREGELPPGHHRHEPPAHHQRRAQRRALSHRADTRPAPGGAIGRDALPGRRPEPRAGDVRRVILPADRATVAVWSGCDVRRRRRHRVRRPSLPGRSGARRQPDQSAGTAHRQYPNQPPLL